MQALIFPLILNWDYTWIQQSTNDSANQPQVLVILLGSPVSAHLDPGRNNTRPGQLQQTRNIKSSWGSGNIQKQESLLQSQVIPTFPSNSYAI